MSMARKQAQLELNVADTNVHEHTQILVQSRTAAHARTEYVRAQHQQALQASSAQVHNAKTAKIQTEAYTSEHLKQLRSHFKDQSVGAVVEEDTNMNVIQAENTLKQVQAQESSLEAELSRLEEQDKDEDDAERASSLQPYVDRVERGREDLKALEGKS